MKLIKLTDKDNKTRKDTQWGENITHELPEIGSPELCSGTVIHAYKSINQAMLMLPIHGTRREFNIWEAEGDIIIKDPTKVGVFKLTTIQEIQPPEWYTNSTTRKIVQVKFAILCAKEVLGIFESRFPNDKRPRKAIESTENWLKTGSADHAAYAADAATDAADAAWAASSAAYAAAFAADAVYAADAAAYAAAYAADAATDAAYAAGVEIDLVKLAEEATK